jgi:hypothetical protein
MGRNRQQLGHETLIMNDKAGAGLTVMGKSQGVAFDGRVDSKQASHPPSLRGQLVT